MPMSHNALIDRLLPATRLPLLDACERFVLTAAQPIGGCGMAVPHVHFPLSGFLVSVIDLKPYPALALGMIGREGLVGGEGLLGSSPSPWRSVVHGSGESWRIATPLLRGLSHRHPDLRAQLDAQLLLCWQQQALATACERFHPVGARLARWLLMSHDRAARSHFHLTQECLGLMLGVRRVSITVAAGALQRLGLIAYHRGEVSVLDRAGLKAQACACYEADLRLMRASLRSA